MAKRQNSKAKDSSPDQDSVWHHVLALMIILPSLMLIAGMAAGIFLLETDKDKASQLVVTSILPLLGAWGGAVIAFYFSGKNLQTATNSVRSLFSQVSPQDKLKSIPVKDKMIARGEMFFEPTSDDKITLSKMLDDLKKSQKGYRIPVLDEQYRPRYMIHRSVIDQYLAHKAVNEKTRAESLPELTLEQLIAEHPELKQSFGLVAEDSTLSDVKKVMDGISHCQDVFVTKSGSEKEEVLGLVTNVIIENNLKI